MFFIIMLSQIFYIFFNFIFNYDFLEFPYKNASTKPKDLVKRCVFQYPYSNYTKRLFFLFSYDYFLIQFYQLFLITFVSFKASLKVNAERSQHCFLAGFTFLWKHIKFWIPSILLIIIIIYYSLVIKTFQFSRIVVEWFLVSMSFYWLISGFVFFGKKYKFGKFTSAIQRFWRRSFIIFWLIESSFFVVFIYLLFNASQEPVFTYDLIQLKKFRLFSWRLFIYKVFPIYVIIILSYILLLNINTNVFSKYVLFLLLISIFLTYIFWVEFYQFFYILNWYGEIIWIFDLEDKVWYAESVFKRARLVNHYLTICIIAKFWHIVFIYIFWIFFILRTLENKNINYVVLSTNLQNMIILLIMNWLMMYPWFKFVFRKFLSKPHSSFKELRVNYLINFFFDFELLLKGFFNFYIFNKSFARSPFIYSVFLPESFNNFFFFKYFLKFFFVIF